MACWAQVVRWGLVPFALTAWLRQHSIQDGMIGQRDLQFIQQFPKTTSTRFLPATNLLDHTARPCWIMGRGRLRYLRKSAPFLHSM
jgi:hypothetical protein